MPVDESESRGNEDDDYNIEHEPGLRAPISRYPVNDQDLEGCTLHWGHV